MPRPFRDQLPSLLRDILSAFGLLTRIPVPFAIPRPEGAWAWPIVGFVVTGLALVVGGAASGMGWTAGPVAALVLAVQATLTGALHEDGLADCADGFFGGRDKTRRLEIMKDSHIGSFGALALMLGVLARWSALTALIGSGHWVLALAAGTLSRAPMAMLMALLPNARGTGLSASVGAPSAVAAMAATALALVIAGALGATVAMVGAVLAVSLGLGLVARAKIGGQTGDVLGAAQQLAEVAALAMATAALK